MRHKEGVEAMHLSAAWSAREMGMTQAQAYAERYLRDGDYELAFVTLFSEEEAFRVRACTRRELLVWARLETDARARVLRHYAA